MVSLCAFPLAAAFADHAEEFEQYEQDRSAGNGGNDVADNVGATLFTE